MSDLVVAAVVLGALYLFCKRTDPAQVPLSTVSQAGSTARALVPSLPQIGRSVDVILGDSYGVPPLTVNNYPPGVGSPYKPPSTVVSPPAQPPPGGVLGGIAGGVAGLFGTGGAPLGGPLTPGVTTGPGTSSVVGLSGFPFGPRLYNGGNPGGN